MNTNNAEGGTTEQIGFMKMHRGENRPLVILKRLVLHKDREGWKGARVGNPALCERLSDYFILLILISVVNTLFLRSD